MMDLHGIDLNLLVALDALIAERNVTRAGQRIGRTQPAMSAALESSAGIVAAFVVRGPQRPPAHATRAGIGGADLAGTAQHSANAGIHPRSDPSAAAMTFSLGLSGHTESVVLPPLIRILADRAPFVPTWVRDYGSRDEATRMLDAGEVDMAVGIPPVETGQILSARLFQDRFVCILRRDHPAANQPFDMEQFLAMPHILVSPENEGLDVADAALATKGLKRRVAVTVQHMASAPELVAASNMVATVLESVVRRSGCSEQLTVRDFPLRLIHSYVLNWHRRNDTHPAQRCSQLPYRRLPARVARL